MQQPAIEYYKLQAQNFACLIKSTIEMIDKFQGLSGKDQLSEQDKAAFRAFKLLFMGQLVEDIQQDLATGRVTEEWGRYSLSTSSPTTHQTTGTAFCSS